MSAEPIAGARQLPRCLEIGRRALLPQVRGGLRTGQIFSVFIELVGVDPSTLGGRS
jgi:hypothetical protein